MKTKPAGTKDNWNWGDEFESGQSTGNKSGTDVTFASVFSSAPRLSLTPHSSASVWLTAVSATGFSWGTDKDNTTVDWIAHLD